MSKPTEISLRCVVTEFLSANINLATDEQVAMLAKSDRIHSWGPVAELDRILHEMLLVREQRIVRREQRAEPVFQCFASGIRTLRNALVIAKWDEFELHDDDGLEWVFLPNPRLPIFEECPLRQPDVALLDIFDNAAVAIIIGDDPSEQQLRAMHCFLADREIGYEIW